MKRIVIYMLALISAILAPLEGTDVGKLRPAELVQLYREGDKVVIVTDTGDSGIGETASAALKNLEETASGVIFLDTADYVLVDESAESEVGAMRAYLKPSVRICSARRSIDLRKAAEHLSAHRPKIKLKDYTGIKELEKLTVENGRLILK